MSRHDPAAALCRSIHRIEWLAREPRASACDDCEVLAGVLTNELLRPPHHSGIGKDCPACNQDVMRIGLPDLAYTFTTCDCDQWPYAHLVETTWHLHCLKHSERP